jgi:DNA-directed RNA polymerase subunit M/transcription elongation factor TFIIS
MSDRWYFAHKDGKKGPFSGRQLMEMAGAGQILRTDTVWKEGVEKGVAASKVQYLFPRAHAKAPPAMTGGLPPAATSSSRPMASGPSPLGLTAAVRPEVAPLSAAAHPTPGELIQSESPEEAESGETTLLCNSPPAAFPDDIQLQPETPAPGTPQRTGSHQRPVRKMRAIALSAATIVGQDGTNVKYRKKCTKCGHEDTSYTTMRITNGVMKAVFFCPKCRKKQDVKIQGNQG